MTTTPEMRFCVKYLLEHGINALNFSEIASKVTTSDTGYTLVKKKEVKEKSFFEELAKALRELWPPGDKMGKYPWRDSIPNLTKRLELLWKERMQGKNYTIEQCVAAARKYLSQFENDTTYMMLLKYFIMKQEQFVEANRHVSFVNKSKLADILESSLDELQLEVEMDEYVSSITADEGQLI